MNIKIPAHVASFSQQFNITEVFEKFTDLFNHYLANNGSAKAEYDKTVSFAEKEQKMNETLIKAIETVSGIPSTMGFAKESMISNPNYNWATFAIVNALVDMVIPDTLLDSIGAYTGIKTGGLNDSFTYHIKSNDLFTVTKVGNGGKRVSNAQKDFEGIATLVPVERDITVQVSLYRVLNGDESLAEFVMKAARSMETEMTLDAYSAFSTAMDALPNTVGSGLRIAGYSQDGIVNLAEVVGGYNNGAKPVIMGTQTALSKVVPSDSNYRYQLESDYVTMGYVKTAFNYDLMVMSQKVDWKDKFKTVLNNKRLYIISPSAQKIVQQAIAGATTSIATGAYDNANLTQTTTLKKKWATGVITNATAGVITLA